MKNVIVLLFVVIISLSSAIGANENIARAYKRKNYKKVCELSKEQDVRNLDFRLKLMLADSYYYIKEASLALTVYSLVLETKDISYFNSTRVENYFELLQIKKRYSKIIKTYPLLSVRNQKNSKVVSVYKSSLFILNKKNLNNDSFKLLDSRELMDVDLEFGMGFLGNSILCYSSAQKKIYNGLLKDKFSGLLHEYAEISENRYTLSCKLFDFNLEKQDPDYNEEYSQINSNANNNFISYVNYSSDDNNAYFTDFSRSSHTQIFIQTEKGNGKIEYRKCSFCKKSFDYAMPCLTNDGKTIYYISNDISGYGGWDIYKSEKNCNGEWGESINLGSNVNTVLDEMYPFLDSENKLYFSSNGHEGFGGFDIYSCDIEKQSLKVTNLLKPVNTEANDFSFIISHARNRAFCLRQINDIHDIQEMMRSFVYNPKTSKKQKPRLRVDSLSISNVGNVISGLVEVGNSSDKTNIKFDRVPELPVGQVLSSTTNVSFPFNKYNVDNDAIRIIEKFLEDVGDVSNYDVILSGYADPKGKENYNLWISHKRIESVADYLVRQCGVAEKQIYQVAYGEYDKYVVNSKKRKVVIEFVGKNKLRNRVLVVYKLDENATVLDLAERFYCNEDDICLINSINDKDKEFPRGALIMIPIKSVHRVSENETLYSISSRYNSRVRNVLEINKISSDYSVCVKDILIIN